MILLLGFSNINIIRNKRQENELKHLDLNFLLKSGKQRALGLMNGDVIILMEYIKTRLIIAVIWTTCCKISVSQLLKGALSRYLATL